MSLLFTQSWNVLPGSEDEYEHFISKSYIPRSNELGFNSVGGFYVMSGQGPRIISVKSVDTIQQLFTILASKEFEEIKSDLKALVSQYTSRVLVQKRKFGPEKYSIQEGVWKFNQYFDIRPGKEKCYDDFMENEFIPAIDKLDYVDFTREWNILIGGFSEVLLELTFKDPVDIGMFLGSEVFKELTHEMNQSCGENFNSKILKTTERFDKPRWFRL
ncbi:MAG: hypothetical protein C0608_11355 [Deltaproteobacteria bacterium]|nr:MAG: hypothetical protein C0608_11355 [Deltaproteobacteria bacterium]